MPANSVCGLVGCTSIDQTCVAVVLLHDVLEGTIEQWIEKEKTILEAGDSVYLNKDVVHASFNVGDVSARLLVVLAPSVGDEGYQLVDVSSEQPWASLRG